MKLHIDLSVHDAMIEHCLAGRPNEACGFLGGTEGRATLIYPLRNSAASPVFYAPDGREMLKALNDLDAKGLDLLAIFHSHVATAPWPSPTDVREAHHPGVVYVIVSLMSDAPDVKGFLIEKADWRDPQGEIVEVDLVVS